MFTPDRPYKIHWELTDLCNLKCPMCPRTDRLDHCRPVPEIEGTQFFLEDVQQCLPERFLEKLTRVDFCGNFGDPCMARDFYEICAFLINSHRVTIMVSTNGAMRAPDWWKELGRLLAGTQSWVEFHIDGLRDTHHRYRIGADWDRIMANTAAFIDGGGRADWHFIVFKHNQHQLDEAFDTARKMGFSHFVPTDTGRFPGKGQIRYMHPDGSWLSLEQATQTARMWVESGKHKLLRSGMDGYQRSASPREAIDEITTEEPMADTFTGHAIVCKASDKNRFFLDSRGYLSPCCWVTNRDIQRPGGMLCALASAEKDLEDFNIRHRPIEDILGDSLFNKTFPKLWRSDQLSTCRKKCGRHHRNIKIKLKL